MSSSAATAGGTPPTISIPLGLRQALEAGDCVVFLGAGVGRHMWRKDKSSSDGVALAADLAKDFKIALTGDPVLTKVSQIVELRKGRPELDAAVEKRLCGFVPDEVYQWLANIRWKAIYTTNYDDGIEQAYANTASPPQTPVLIGKPADIQAFDRRFQVPAYFLHGKACGTNKSKIVITENDYAEFRKQRQMMFEVLKTEFATSTFLYIGYSNQDPNWNMLLEELRSEFYPSPLPQSYRIAPSTDAIDEEILRSKHVETIPCTFSAFRDAAILALAGSKVSTDALARMQATVPIELLPAFEKNPAAVARLLNSWEYVNRAPFGATPNTREFFRGDKANWALIAKDVAFRRDLEEELYDSVLDYATSSSKVPTTRLVLAPAGYGTTTFIRQIASRLVNDRAGNVFLLKDGMPLLQGDIEFAASLFPGECPFFIIDNPADFQEDVYTAIQRLRNLSQPALFILGERLNEWRYARRGKSPGREFEIQPLSDTEIDRLLMCLEAHNELNALRDLSPEFRQSAIKATYQKELLVTLREATEGKGFDAIIEDEFRSIPSETAQSLYLAVCCFYQHGAFMRDTLLADLVGQDVSEMYRETAEATAGVVIFEETDPSYGHYAARARHRKIASVVWERCGDLANKEQIILDALARMNLNHRADIQAFENFVRSDRLVDSVRKLEDRINFFESACSKDPTSPYVRQHYARMLARSKQYSLALGQIEEAIKINSNIRVLHHTKGIILHELAMGTESKDIARRRLVQSEEEFKYCINESPRDEYAHQSLARLYLDWAKRSDDPTEATDYLTKTEATISAGLRQVRVRDGLFIVSAEVEGVLGNEPERMKALVKAATGSGSSIAKYMLGRAYRENSDPAKAAETLKPVLESNPEEFRIAQEYALALEALGESIQSCLAVMKLSTLYGLSDPKFVAIYGGMSLLSGDLTEAKDIFANASRREFPAGEANKIYYRPLDPADRSRFMVLIGTVAKVRPGYAFIDVAGYPSFFCPGSKFGKLVMREGLSVKFDVAFNTKGQTVQNVKAAT